MIDQRPDHGPTANLSFLPFLPHPLAGGGQKVAVKRSPTPTGRGTNKPNPLLTYP